MRQNIIVAQGRDDWNFQGLVCVADLAKYIQKLVRDESVRTQNLVLGSRDLFVAVMACRVARPYNKIDMILDVFLDPFECRVHEREGRVAIRGFCTVRAGCALSVMAGIVFFGGRMDFVEGIRM